VRGGAGAGRGRGKRKGEFHSCWTFVDCAEIRMQKYRSFLCLHCAFID
jgi:hypothetical protein